MKKKTVASAMDKEQCQARLEEIAGMVLGALTNDEALAILKEREQLEELWREYEKAEKAEAMRMARLERERAEIETAIAELNKTITPDKSDDELFALIGKRKELEARLESLEEGSSIEQDKVEETFEVPAELVVAERKNIVETSNEATVADSEPITEEVPVAPMGLKEVSGEAPVLGASRAALPEDFGGEGIRIDPIEMTGELKQYFDQLRSNSGSLGTLLQHLPAPVKANKAFMLKVAEIDPAYAMHYADPGLKRDEDFDIRVVRMPNKRNSGNALAEIDPSMRTSQVVMAGVKQDYRNIRFASPVMEGYREMIEIAKRGTLHKIQELKHGADIALLVPKILQKDAEFMRQAENAVAAFSVVNEQSSKPGLADDAIEQPVEKSVWKINPSQTA